MLSTVRQFVPNTWENISFSTQNDVNSFSEEYRQLEYEIRRSVDSSTPTLRRVIRGQDVYAFGQFLIREQLLLNSNGPQLYRVRRFIQISKVYLDDVLKHNLDPRRCGMGQSLTFRKKIQYCNYSQLLVIVKVLTTQPESETLSPSSSCEYYVEYVVDIQI